MTMWQIKSFLFGFIIQPSRSPNTSLCHIDHLGNFWSCIVLWRSFFSLIIRYPNGSVGWLLSRTKFLQFWCIEKYLRNWKFVKLRDRRYLAFRTFLYVRFGLRFIAIFWRDAHLMPWSLSGIFLKIWSEAIILELNIIRCAAFWSAFHNICPFWGYCDFPHEWDHGKLIIKNRMELRWYMTSGGVEYQSLWTWMKWWVTKVYAWTWERFQIGQTSYVTFVILHPRHKLEIPINGDFWE